METEQQQIDFIKLTTEGYPVDLKHPKDDFYEIFQKFVNDSNENNFFAIINQKKINESGESSTGEFTADEEFSILGHACLGVLYFCDLYALGTGQKTHFASAKESETNNSTKYKAWPV